MKPTIGRVVLFHPIEGQIHAAVIAFVHSDTLINLAAFDQNGVAYSRTSITLIQRAETPPEFSMWCEWPIPVELSRAVVALPVLNTPPAAVTGATVEADIQAKGLTAPRVTPADIEANVASEHYFTASEGVVGKYALRLAQDGVGTYPGDLPKRDPQLSLLTFCVLILHNGFIVIGESTCASPENFNAEIGRKIARENAKQKIWSLMGYQLRSMLAGHVAGIDFGREGGEA